jgi:hypothetical protein
MPGSARGGGKAALARAHSKTCRHFGCAWSTRSVLERGSLLPLCESGGKPPHSKTCRHFGCARRTRSVVECGTAFRFGRQMSSHRLPPSRGWFLGKRHGSAGASPYRATLTPCRKSVVWPRIGPELARIALDLPAWTAQDWAMPPQRRIQYEGAIRHVLSRGDRREAIFTDGVHRHDFLKTLADARRKTGCPCLPPDEEPLPQIVETPPANLAARERLYGEERGEGAWRRGSSGRSGPGNGNLPRAGPPRPPLNTRLCGTPAMTSYMWTPSAP